MHSRLSPPVRRVRSRDAATDEGGAVAVIVALTMTVLLVIAGMVLDFGLVRADRQADKSAADSATLAGLHGLALAGDAKPHPYVGICSAIRYLRSNNARFSGVTSAAGTWKDGVGASVANAGGCTDPTLLGRVCVPGTTSSWLSYAWTGTYQGTALKVTIKSGYALSSASGWQEDSLPAATTFQDDSAQGCDQLAVMVTQNRKPGFGSLAQSNDLVSAIRSVGRVKLKPGDSAPAMLLLRRTGCPILETGSNSGGSHVYVYGALSSDGRSQGGSIHADSSGASCSGGSNQNIFLGKASSGIVAFTGPLASNPSVADPSKPGFITAVAGSVGASAAVISDGSNNVFSSGAIAPAGIGAASKTAASGRGLITRKVVDDRYLAAVQSIVNASASRWSPTLTAGNAAAAGYSVVANCTPAAGSVPNVAKVFINCTANGGFKGPYTFGANTTEVVFNGSVNPSGLVSIPNATKVYIYGAPGSNALDLGNGATFSVHSSGNLTGTPSLCTNATRTSTNKAIVVLKAGQMKQTGGMLQLCNTTLIQMGNVNDACLSQVPSQQASGPAATPCSGGAGDGQLSQTGGSVDWTAPNSLDITTDANGNSLPTALAGWADTGGPEDLAYWSESHGAQNPSYNMNGGSTLHVVGVFMIPNAEPFSIGGGAQQTLSNAQYIASSISLNGTGTEISMKVDPNAAITLPDFGLVGLVR